MNLGAALLVFMAFAINVFASDVGQAYAPAFGSTGWRFGREDSADERISQSNRPS